MTRPDARVEPTEVERAAARRCPPATGNPDVTASFTTRRRRPRAPRRPTCNRARMTPDERREHRVRDRAYILSQEDATRTADENWLRAEQEVANEEALAILDEATERGHEVGIRTALTHP